MHYSYTRWIIKLVILLLFTTILPFQSSELYAQRSGSSKSATKKKSSSKKSSRKKKKASSRKRSKSKKKSKAKKKKSSKSNTQAKKYLDRGKKRLKAKGFFDEKNKKELPYLPSRLGIITSSTGSVAQCEPRRAA